MVAITFQCHIAYKPECLRHQVSQGNLPWLEENLHIRTHTHIRSHAANHRVLIAYATRKISTALQENSSKEAFFLELKFTEFT